MNKLTDQIELLELIIARPEDAGAISHDELQDALPELVRDSRLLLARTALQRAPAYLLQNVYVERAGRQKLGYRLRDRALATERLAELAVALRRAQARARCSPLALA